MNHICEMYDHISHRFAAGVALAMVGERNIEHD